MSTNAYHTCLFAVGPTGRCIFLYGSACVMRLAQEAETEVMKLLTAGMAATDPGFYCCVVEVRDEAQRLIAASDRSHHSTVQLERIGDCHPVNFPTIRSWFNLVAHPANQPDADPTVGITLNFSGTSEA